MDGDLIQIVDPVACRSYGALTEGVHIAGYTLERAWTQLEWLLEDGRWQHLGQNFEDVNKFLDSVRLDNFRIVADQRKRIADRIRELQPEVSNRAIGRVLGVNHATIDRDAVGENAPSEQQEAKETAAPGGGIGANAPSLSGPEVADLARKAETGELKLAGPRPDPAAQRGQPTRDGPDFWPTPHSLVSALVRFVLPELPAGPIWECASGDDRVVRALAEAGRKVVATDLYPQDGSRPRDFLKDDPPLRHAITITNPPFNQSEEFLQRGLELLDADRIKGLVLLLRHDHLMAGSRTGIFNRAVHEVHCNWRPIWIADTDGNPRWSFHWLAWHAGRRRPPLYLSLAEVE